MSHGGASRISYRQVGRKKHGSLRRGPAGRASTSDSSALVRPRTKPSIPSRFETELHHGASENDGFGSASQRFRYQDTEVPGPGNYGSNSQKSTFLWNSDIKGSVSKKGYGVGFVSKTQRFTNRSLLEAAITPGPGSNANPGSSKFTTRKDFSRGSASGNFAKPRKYRDDPVNTGTGAPGPGAYRPRESEFAGNTTASAFRSGTRRFRAKDDFGVTGRVPGPGSHNVLAAARWRSSQGRNRGPSSTFRSRSERGRHMVTGRDIPGPGEYNVARTAENPSTEAFPREAPVGGLRVLGYDDRRRLARRKQDGLFFGSLGCDRFGKPYVRKTTQATIPGPGTYGDHTADVRERALASSSMFLSQSKRGIDAQLGGLGGRPPGPAAYVPQSSMRKSFLLNASRRWV